MKIVSFKNGQNGKDWHKWRSQGIGASDISVLTGSNQFRTSLQLWEIKCGYREEDPMNAAMQHGVDNEPIARQWLNDHFQLHLEPVCIEDIEKPYFRASLDGFDFNHETLCEIKCPISEKVLDRAHKEQAIPDYWFDQMQWQIMLCKPKRAFIALWDYRHNSCITIDMFGHTKKIEKMRELGEEFWRRVQNGRAPEADSKKDFIKIEDENLKEKLLEYKELIDKETTLKYRKKEVRDEIVDYGDDGSFIAYGFKVQRISPRTTFNIDQMRLDGIDVDSYIKKSNTIGAYRIIPPK